MAIGKKAQPGASSAAEREAGLAEYIRTGQPVSQETSNTDIQQAGSTENQNTIKTVNRNAVSPDNQQAVSTPSRNTIRPAFDNHKVKVTYYIEESSAEALEDVWHRLRQLAGRKRATSISRSDIVDYAFREILADLERNGKNSDVVRKLLGEL